ncbi:MAG TPA: hypothetical protein VGC54_10430 [Planctomycetota bacterium]
MSTPFFRAAAAALLLFLATPACLQWEQQIVILRQDVQADVLEVRIVIRGLYAAPGMLSTHVDVEKELAPLRRLDRVFWIVDGALAIDLDAIAADPDPGASWGDIPDEVMDLNRAAARAGGKWLRLDPETGLSFGVLATTETATAWKRESWRNSCSSPSRARLTTRGDALPDSWPKTPWP